MNKDTIFNLKYPVVYYETKSFRLKDLPPYLQEYIIAFTKDEEKLTKKEWDIVFNKYDLSDILEYFGIQRYKMDGDIELIFKK